MNHPADAAIGEHSARKPTKSRGIRGNPRLTLLSAALGVMMVAIDGTIVAVANPSIQANLGASLAATVGVAPVQKGVSPQVAGAIADVTHATFISGMTAAFLVASVVAVGGALIALLTRKGHAPAH